MILTSDHKDLSELVLIVFLFYIMSRKRMNFYVVSKADKLHKYREDDYFGKPLTIIFLESISKLIQLILSCPETPLSIPRKQDSF